MKIKKINKFFMLIVLSIIVFAGTTFETQAINLSDYVPNVSVWVTNFVNNLRLYKNRFWAFILRKGDAYQVAQNELRIKTEQDEFELQNDYLAAQEELKIKAEQNELRITTEQDELKLQNDYLAAQEELKIKAEQNELRIKTEQDELKLQNDYLAAQEKLKAKYLTDHKYVIMGSSDYVKMLDRMQFFKDDTNRRGVCEFMQNFVENYIKSSTEIRDLVKTEYDLFNSRLKSLRDNGVSWYEITCLNNAQYKNNQNAFVKAWAFLEGLKAFHPMWLDDKTLNAAIAVVESEFQ